MLTPTASIGVVDYFMKHESLVDAVIYFVKENVHVSSNGYSCDQYNSYVSETVNIFADAFGSANVPQRLSIKHGLEYDQSVLECWFGNQANSLQQFDLTVLRLLVTPLDDLFSFGLFSKKLTKLVSENEEFVRKYNNNCTTFIRILLQVDANETITIQHKYKALIAQYVSSWMIWKKKKNLFWKHTHLKQN